MNNKEQSFWDWSLQHYAEQGVEPCLLNLQDQFGLNVNILLWCCWCAQQKFEINELHIRKAVDLTAQWNSHVVDPLRAVRIFLKDQTEAAATDDLRRDIKSAELASEKIAQLTLEKFATDKMRRMSTPVDALAAARRAIANYAALTGAPRKKDFSVSLLESLVSLIFQRSGQRKEAT